MFIPDKILGPDIVRRKTLEPAPDTTDRVIRRIFPFQRGVLAKPSQNKTWNFHNTFERRLTSRTHIPGINGAFIQV